MSENNSKEMDNIIGRSKKLRSTMFKPDFFNEEEIKELNERAHNNIMPNLDKIGDDMDLAMLITNGGLVHRDNNAIYNLGITQALLAKQVETTYGVKSWFMERDQDKQVTLYELFTNEYFEKMFGDKGYKQLFSGDAKGFIEDFKKYGATDEEILNFDRSINNSVFNGEYNYQDCKSVSELCQKISKGRENYRELPKEEIIEPKKMTL